MVVVVGTDVVVVDVVSQVLVVVGTEVVVVDVVSQVLVVVERYSGPRTGQTYMIPSQHLRTWRSQPVDRCKPQVSKVLLRLVVDEW